MEFLIYDLKVAALIAVFYMFYRLLLSRETLHRMNRVVLLTMAVASFVLPLCVITIHHTVVVPQATTSVMAGLPMMAVIESEPLLPLWQQAAIGVFFTGLAVTLGYVLWSVGQVVRLVRRSEHHRQADGTVVCVTDKDVSPFSFCNYIVLNRHDYESLDPAIMAHERGHIRLHHSADVLLVDTLTALQWFNPAMWMLRQDLRAIHEYEADAAVLSQGINMRQYQYLLIQKAVATCGYSVANGITHSTLKNRINMMLTHKKTNRASWLKLLAMLPIVGVALALNAETVNDYVYEDTQEQPQKKIVKKGRKNGKIKVNDKTIEVQEAKAEDTPQAESESADTEPRLIIDGKVATDAEQEIIQMRELLGDREPLIVINGKVATPEQLKAINPKEIDNVSVIKNEEVLKEYAKHFKADTSNGILFFNTKEYVKNGKKELVSVEVKAKEAQEGTVPMAIGTFTPDTSEPDKAFDVVENMPEFPGGMAEMMKFLSTNVKYPASALKDSIQGRVIATFIVEKDGSTSNIKVVKHVSDDLDAEAVRVIELMPKWIPGRQNGKEVRVKYTIPIAFRLQ